MPSPIAHSATGYILAQLFPLKHKTVRWSRNWKCKLLSIFFAANAPDLDFILQILTGENYHRGISHSLGLAIGFSCLWGLIAYLIWRPLWQQIFGLTFVLYSSHLVLDYFTAGGNGIPFFWPLSNSWFIADTPIFPSVKHSRGFIDASHLNFLSFELSYSMILFLGLWCWSEIKKLSKKS